ncbi:hypothetical protein ACVWXN_008773 [Bradyrhizobium sp. i1.4.4]
MDLDELAIQREGYAQAIVSKDFLQALRARPASKVALTYFEWSMSGDDRIIIPWRVIDGPESADAVAAEIMKTPIRRGSSTSISGAIQFRSAAVRRKSLSRVAARHRHFRRWAEQRRSPRHRRARRCR